MNRTEFLKSIGLGGAAIMATYCMGGMTGCKSDTPTPTAVDFTINLDDSAYSSLKTSGNYLIINSVVIANTTKGAGYVAVTQICSHEGNPNVTYNKNDNEFDCPVHGARYTLAGKGLNAEGSNGIKVYQTSLTGSNLRVFS